MIIAFFDLTSYNIFNMDDGEMEFEITVIQDSIVQETGNTEFSMIIENKICNYVDYLKNLQLNQHELIEFNDVQINHEAYNLFYERKTKRQSNP